MGLCRLCRPQSSRNRITERCGSLTGCSNFERPDFSKRSRTRARKSLTTTTARNSHNRRMGLNRRRALLLRGRRSHGWTAREASRRFSILLRLICTRPTDEYDDDDHRRARYVRTYVCTTRNFVCCDSSPATAIRKERKPLHAHSPHAQGTRRRATFLQSRSARLGDRAKPAARRKHRDSGSPR